jgi:hypothetical protein
VLPKAEISSAQQFGLMGCRVQVLGRKTDAIPFAYAGSRSTIADVDASTSSNLRRNAGRLPACNRRGGDMTKLIFAFVSVLVSASAVAQDLDQPAKLVRWMRIVNTLEVEFKMTNHRFGTTDELLAYAKSGKQTATVSTS